MEKKWCVHAQGRQEGPLSLGEMHSRIAAGQASAQDHVWCEGMEDWKRVEDIAELRVPLNVRPPVALKSTSSRPPPIEELSAIIDMRPDRPSEYIDVKHLKLAHQEAAKAEKLSQKAGKKVAEASGTKRSRRGLGYLFAAMLILGSGIGIAYNQGYFDPWLKALPRVEELTAEENSELLAAATVDLQSVGPSIAFSLSQQNPSAPIAYAATNLPDGSNLDLRIHGIGPTLLNEVEFDLYIPLTVSQKVIKSPPIRMKDGSAIPAGQYLITFTDSVEQPDSAKRALARLQPVTAPLPATVPAGRRLLAKKVFTLLGGTREDTYSSLLRDYHAKLRDQASAESREINDWLAVVVKSFDSTRESFDKIRPIGQIDQRRKQWNAFHDDWLKELAPYVDKFEAYKPGATQGKLFYGAYYRMIYGIWQSVSRVHDLQTTFMTTLVDPATYDREITEALKLANERVVALKEKMADVERGWSKTGYPPREGI